MKLELRKENQQLWNSFVEGSYSLVREFEFTNIPADSDKFVVMVEPREHPHLEYVLRNAMHMLGPEWGLQIFVGENNKQFVEKIVKHWKQVHVCQISTNNLSAQAYNQLKKLPSFWELIKGEHVLWIECDCLLCNGNIDEFLKYDFIGAPWSREIALSKNVRVGNGGLSLRRKSAMIEIGSMCNPDVRIFPQEDVFFTVNMRLQKDKYCLPELEVAKRFAVESVFYPSPLGLHKTWKYLAGEQLQLLLQSIEYK